MVKERGLRQDKRRKYKEVEGNLNMWDGYLDFIGCSDDCTNVYLFLNLCC